MFPTECRPLRTSAVGLPILRTSLEQTFKSCSPRLLSHLWPEQANLAARATRP